MNIAVLTNFAIIYGTKLITALVIFFLGKLGAKLISNLVKRVIRRSSWGEIAATFIGNIVYYGLLAFVAITALNKLGLQTTSFVAILGAAGLAIGLALQGSLSNFASGTMIVIFRPFKVGDFVEAGGATGIVEEIQIFNTILKTPDNKEVVVPNSQITGGKITNYSKKPIRRVDLVFGIGYDDDILQAKKILWEIVKADERILTEPPTKIAVSELGDSSVNFVVRPFVKTADYWDVYFDVTEKVKLRFDEAGITIPYPQRDVHLFNEK